MQNLGQNMFSKFIELLFRGQFGKPTGIRGKILVKQLNKQNKNQYNAVIRNIGLKTNNVILEIGFGNGYLIKELFKQNILIKIYGIDISEDMLNEAKIKNKQKFENGDLKLFLEDITRTSFDEDFFDKIYTVNTIYFWSDINSSLSEIKRILKVDGVFINVFSVKSHLNTLECTKYGFNKYTLEEVEKATENNGFNINNIVEINENSTYAIIAENTD